MLIYKIIIILYINANDCYACFDALTFQLIIMKFCIGTRCQEYRKGHRVKFHPEKSTASMC